MTFDEAIAVLDARIRFGVQPGLERMWALMDVLDHPQRTYPCLHVSGTNGKYSVTVLVEAILQGLGLNVGTYTSPHIESIRERISIGGGPVGEEELAAVVEYLLPYLDLVEKDREDRLTYFETVTAVALEAFFDRAIHAAVLEAGLGGEWDATNVADARVAVVTKVARDHIVEFSDDPRQAAWEKAGTIKPGTFALTGVEQPELVEIVQARVAERGGEGLAVLGRDLDVVDRKLAVGGQMLRVQGLHGMYDELFLPVYGEHQAANAALAVGACEAFTGGPLAVEELRAGLAKARMPGRIEVAARRPLVVLDGGHNPDAAAAVLGTVQDAFVFDRLLCVIGMLEDKLVEDVLALVGPACDRFIVTAPAAGRAADAERLVAGLAEAGVSRERIIVQEGVGEALGWALDAAHEDDVVLVFGSFYTVGEARSWLRDHRLLSHP